MNESKLSILSELPEGFLECGTRDLNRMLGGPTLIHLAGEHPGPPLFISTLLHGNETTGFIALQEVLTACGGKPQRPLTLFIGNVAAAEQDERFLPGQPDYNRIWMHGQGPEHDIAQRVLDIMGELDVCACVDIHNNTGRNPHYAIVSTRDAAHMALARGFGRRIVYATYPDTSCSVAFGRLCPAVTVEAGLVGDASGVDHVVRFLELCLEADIWNHEPDPDLELFHTVAVVRVRDSCTVGMQGEGADVEISPDIDRLNFTMIDAGTHLATTSSGCDCINVQTEQHVGGGGYLSMTDGELRTARRIMPAMLTTDCDIIRMDCLCYLMEEIL